MFGLIKLWQNVYFFVYLNLSNPKLSFPSYIYLNVDVIHEDPQMGQGGLYDASEDFGAA